MTVKKYWHILYQNHVRFLQCRKEHRLSCLGFQFDNDFYFQQVLTLYVLETEDSKNPLNLIS